VCQEIHSTLLVRQVLGWKSVALIQDSVLLVCGTGSQEMERCCSWV
jgi:hypothetical protein